jgi:peptide/nickel transport system substrate-binding protein
VEAAKRLLADSGYAGEPITLMAAQDVPQYKAWGDLTVDLLKRLDMKVDFAALDAGTWLQRRVQKSPPRQGGWHMTVSSAYGILLSEPGGNFLRANGDSTSNGFAKNPQIEAEIAAWYNATSLDEEKTIAQRLNRLAVDDVLYVPLGAHLRHHAWRKNLSGIVQAPLPLFWGISKTG